MRQNKRNKKTKKYINVDVWEKDRISNSIKKERKKLGKREARNRKPKWQTSKKNCKKTKKTRRKKQ